MKRVYTTNFQGRELCERRVNWPSSQTVSVFISYGDTAVMVTACMAKEARENADTFRSA